MTKLHKGYEPVIAVSEDINIGLDILMSKKYEVIGYSSFNGRYEDYKNAIVQAKAIEATHVIIIFKHTDDRTAKPVGPDTTALISGVVSGSTPGGAPLHGSSVAPSVSANNKLFDHEAKYLVKSNRKYKLGILRYFAVYPEQSTSFGLSILI